MNFADFVAGASFAPLIPPVALAALAALAAALFALGVWRRGRGAWLRAAAAAVVLTALANPRLARENREPLSDVAFVVVDETESMDVDGRDARAAAVAAALGEAAAGASDNGDLELRVVRVRDAAGRDASSPDYGTLAFRALRQAAADVDPDRIAGAILVTDGRVDDAPAADDAVEFPAPIHHLNVGRPGEFDRRLEIDSAAAFGIVGETVEIRLNVEDLGDFPIDAPPYALVSVRVNGEIVRADRLPVGPGRRIYAPLNRGGLNVVEVLVDKLPGEVTLRNNRAAFTVYAARDRLRVLLMTGAPNPGSRAWRNLLKADPSVDLVHFAILRRHEQTPGDNRDLALIPFPAYELFVEQIDDFDLIIFDQTANRPDMLSSTYLDNIGRRVRRGGALLVSAGVEFSGFESLAYTPIGDILPAAPNGRVEEVPFIPRISEIGARHPVTAGLIAHAGARPSAETPDVPTWGPWARRVGLRVGEGDVLMQAAAGEATDSPLLLLRRAGRGRVAMLASDTSWLWSRGLGGGGPQDELLRRVAHWLMYEPELEEEALSAVAADGELTIERRSVGEGPTEARITAPSGDVVAVPFEEVAPGRWRAVAPAAENGLYRVRDGELEALASLGPASPAEFVNPVSTLDVLAPAVAASGGAQLWIEDAAAPDLRRVAPGEPAVGDGWIGLVRREAYIVRDVRQATLSPGWLALPLALLLIGWAWRREGR